MGFIERFRVECLRSVLINTHMIEAAHRARCSALLFLFFCCVYNTQLQQNPKVRPLKESDAFLRWPSALWLGEAFSEMLCQEYCASVGCRLSLPVSTMCMVPMAPGWWPRKGSCRRMPKVLEAVDTGITRSEIWGTVINHAASCT